MEPGRGEGGVRVHVVLGDAQQGEDRPVVPVDELTAGEHLAEVDLGALRRGGMVLGDATEELVEAADAGFPDAQVAQGRQDVGTQAGLVALDGLWGEAFFGGDLFDPEFGEPADACLAGDLVVVGCGPVAQLELQGTDGGGCGGVGGFDVAGGAVVVTEPGTRTESVGPEFLGADLSPGADG